MTATSPAGRFGVPILRLLAFAALLPLVGCGSDPDKPKLGKVSGTVTYNGKPIPSGSIIFTPAGAQGGKTGQSATGQIDNGKYTLTTFDTGDGAILGQHAVTVTASSTPGTELGKVKSDGTLDYKLPKSAIPEKYTTIDKSPLKYTVDAGGKTIDIELKD